MVDVHLPLNLNIQEFRGEQPRLTGDTDMTAQQPAAEGEHRRADET